MCFVLSPVRIEREAVGDLAFRRNSAAKARTQRLAAQSVRAQKLEAAELTLYLGSLQIGYFDFEGPVCAEEVKIPIGTLPHHHNCSSRRVLGTAARQRLHR
jgi:hypothetical protein